MNIRIMRCLKALAPVALAAFALGIIHSAASANSCGKARISNVSPASSTLSNTNQFWNVLPGTTVTVTLSGVTECSGDTIEVIVQSTPSGNYCTVATKVSDGVYTFDYPVPLGGCATSIVDYCTTGCSPSTGYKALDANGKCPGHLRVADSTGAACKPQVVGCKGSVFLGCNPATLPTCDNAQQLGGYTVTGQTSCGTPLPVTCSIGAITSSGCNRYQVVTYSTKNDCGTIGSCKVTFRWKVVTAPVFDNGCPPDIDLGCNPPTIPGCDKTIEAHNECGEVCVKCTKSDKVDGCLHTRTITYSAYDPCSNMTTTCVQKITWRVVTAPVFDNCPTDQDLGCNPTVPGCDGTVTAHNECGAVPVTCDTSDSGPTDCNHYTRTITYTATDPCSGFSATCVQHLTWTVLTPTITCPPDANVCKEDFLPGDISLSGAATAVDNCDNPVDFTNIDFSDGPTTDIVCPDGQAGFTFVRTWTATLCGAQDSCQQVITVCPCKPECFPFGQGCTVTLGYWKTHGPGDCHKGNNNNDWPAGTITVGCNTYDTVTDAAAICDMLSASGQALIPQLIAAQLNLLNNSKDGGAGIQAIIDAANACLCAGGDCTGFTTALDNYNSGVTGPGHCGTCP